MSLLNERQLDFIIKLHTFKKSRKVSLMTDTKASIHDFVKLNFVKYYKLSTIVLTSSVQLKLIDNDTTHQLTHMTQVKIQLNEHLEKFWCFIASINRFEIILDMSWLKNHDVHIECENRSLFFEFEYCLNNCLINNRLSIAYECEIKSTIIDSFKTLDTKTSIAKISIVAFMKMTFSDKNQIIAMWSKHFAMLNQSTENDAYLLLSAFTINIAAVSVQNYEKFFNKTKRKFVTMKKLKKRISENFHKYLNNWNLKKVNKISSHRKWNHRINLKSESTSSVKKAYELSRDQVTVVKHYINDMLSKNFIRFSYFDYFSSVLIVKKSEDEFKVCVDYRALNALTIKNRNTSSLIREILVRLCAAKIYIKFDIIATFNEIRIKKENEHKIAFLIRYNLFEYVVMSFELCNASNTFQFFINATFREYLNDFCTVYLNDILIYSDNRENHTEHVNKVLERLQKIELFLDIDKCEFFTTEMKYLSLIITIEDIKMNSIKIDVVINWKTSRCLKNVQAFLRFANFYRRFIFDYSRITISLIKLTKIIDTSTIFSWNSDDPEENAFQVLKLTFIIAFILIHFDFDKKTWIETDVSNYVVVAILSQKKKNDQLHFVAFMSKKMSFAKCNYEIYDKKLLIIIRTFEKWKSKCADTSMKNSIRIFTDHKNLEHFMTIKQLNRRQVRWIEFLSKFNFQITYRSDVQNIKSDNLTRRFEDLFQDALNDRIKYNF